MEKISVVNPVQFKKALSCIVVTEPGIVTEANLLQPLKALYPIVVSAEGVEKLTAVKPIQPRKASSPKEVTDVGMSIETNFEQL